MLRLKTSVFSILTSKCQRSVWFIATSVCVHHQWWLFRFACRFQTTDNKPLHGMESALECWLNIDERYCCNGQWTETWRNVGVSTTGDGADEQELLNNCVQELHLHLVGWRMIGFCARWCARDVLCHLLIAFCKIAFPVLNSLTTTLTDSTLRFSTHVCDLKTFRFIINTMNCWCEFVLK